MEQNIFDLHLYFNYRPQTWYKGLDVDGNWYDIVTNDGANPPVDAFNFATDLLSIIPANE